MQDLRKINLTVYVHESYVSTLVSDARIDPVLGEVFSACCARVQGSNLARESLAASQPPFTQESGWKEATNRLAARQMSQC